MNRRRTALLLNGLVLPGLGQLYLGRKTIGIAIIMLVNLLLLARNAFSNGGEHTIRIRSHQNGSGTIHVEVTDNGTPIPAVDYEHIFEPQLIPTGEGRGTGLEFSICREIARQNRGQIAISGNDHETTIRISFTGEG